VAHDNLLRACLVGNSGFPLSGSTLKGISKPGELVWSRIFVMDGQLHADMGRGTAVKLPEKEAHR
jgi:hypothetical protein